MAGDVRQHTIPEAEGLPYRLGRHVNHDPRSLAHPFTADGVTIVSKVWPRRAPIFDQGQLGSCTGNAAAGWVGTDNAIRTGIATESEKDAVAIYEAATKIDPYDGAYPPDDTGSDGLSVTKVLKAEGFVDTYQHCFSLDAVLAALMSGPVLVGTNWYDGMFDPNRTTGIVSISGAVVGGHEYLVDGVDTVQQTVTFANSWGSGWGKSGWGRMTYATLTRLLSEDGDATVPHALVNAPVPPEPVPPTPPVPDNPWWVRLWHWLFGWLNKES